MVDGIAQKPIEGVSMAYTFDKANANAPSTRKTQYFEMIGNRGIYHDGWYACTTPPVPPWMLNAPMPDVNDYKWELYNLAEDYSQANDLAAQDARQAQGNAGSCSCRRRRSTNVLPLDNRTFARAIAPRPSATAGQTVFTYSGEMPGIPTGNAPNILNKSYTITAEVEVPQGGGDGMIVTEGGRFGGYGLYLLKGKPVFNYNFLMLEQFRWEGSGRARAGQAHDRVRLHLRRPRHRQGRHRRAESGRQGRRHPEDPAHDRRSCCRLTRPSTSGVDTRTAVNDKDYQVPFRFTGKLDKLTVKLGPR